MAKENLTEIVAVLDRSGSMHSIKLDMEGGFNRFIEDQKKEPSDCKVTLAQFDDQYEIVYEAKSLAEVPLLSLVPRNSTALLDAVGRTIVAVGDRLDKTPEEERPSKVIFIIITDGYENSSKEYSGEKVLEMVKHQREKYSWEFVFIGANQDAIATAAKMGIAYGANFIADAQGTSDMYQGVSRGVSGYRGGRGYTP